MESKNIGQMHKRILLPEPLKTGWPWTATPQAQQATLPTGSPWPRISIVTPSLNQGQFLEETIRSVLLQRYPNLEYIIIDGGSTDNSLDVIHKYEPWLAYWVSEPDRGQSHAINKGFAVATGDILAWIASDDTYLESAFQLASETLHSRPEIALVFGSAYFIDENGKIVGDYKGVDDPFLRKLMYYRGWNIPQPTVFFRKSLLEETGPLDVSFHYALDYDWLLRAAKNGNNFYCVPEVISTYRTHPNSKTGDWEKMKHKFYAECAKAVRKHVRWYTVDKRKLVFDRITYEIKIWLHSWLPATIWDKLKAIFRPEKDHLCKQNEREK